MTTTDRLAGGPVQRALRAFSQLRTGRGIRRFINGRKDALTLGRVLSGRSSNLDDIEAYIRAHPTQMRLPLVMISQVHRSGGTLLSQLFDGHPMLAAHPNELTIGFPTNEEWPPLDPALGADRNFRMMFNDKIVRQMRNGYTKGTGGPSAESPPIFLVPTLHFRLFKHLFVIEPPKNAREILGHFFSTYFESWLNYRGNLREKRWITGFAPRFANYKPSVAGFFGAYPDGYLIQIIRGPKTWYPSAKFRGRSDLRGKGPEEILDDWSISAEAILRNKAEYGERVIVIGFEDLVGRTEQTMRALADVLGIAYDPILASPTFNGEMIRANSTFDVASSGVISAPLDRAKMLSDEERLMIDRRCTGLYERILLSALPVSDRAPQHGAETNRRVAGS